MSYIPKKHTLKQLRLQHKRDEALLAATRQHAMSGTPILRRTKAMEFKGESPAAVQPVKLSFEQSQQSSQPSGGSRKRRTYRKKRTLRKQRKQRTRRHRNRRNH